MMTFWKPAREKIKNGQFSQEFKVIGCVTFRKCLTFTVDRSLAAYRTKFREGEAVCRGIWKSVGMVLEGGPWDSLSLLPFEGS